LFYYTLFNRFRLSTKIARVGYNALDRHGHSRHVRLSL